MDKTIGVIIDELIQLIQEKLYEGSAYVISGGLESTLYSYVGCFADGFKIDEEFWVGSIVPAIAEKYNLEGESFEFSFYRDTTIGDIVMKTANIIIYLLRR